MGGRQREYEEDNEQRGQTSDVERYLRDPFEAQREIREVRNGRTEMDKYQGSV